jgi:hypothetical protein
MLVGENLSRPNFFHSGMASILHKKGGTLKVSFFPDRWAQKML